MNGSFKLTPYHCQLFFVNCQLAFRGQPSTPTYTLHYGMPHGTKMLWLMEGAYAIPQRREKLKFSQHVLYKY
jgi:hypothetical protein